MIGHLAWCTTLAADRAKAEVRETVPAAGAHNYQAGVSRGVEQSLDGEAVNRGHGDLRLLVQREFPGNLGDGLLGTLASSVHPYQCVMGALNAVPPG
jgi:hypothetical protein